MEYRNLQRVKDAPKLFLEPDNEIVMPQIEYKRVGIINGTDKFTGEIASIPQCLLEYLKDLEVKLFAVIMEQQRRGGSCVIRYKTFGAMYGCTTTSIANAMARLRDMGLIELTPFDGRKKGKAVNIKAVQFLNDFTKDLRPGALSALRKEAGSKNILKLPKVVLDSIKRRFDASDPDEFEEYV